MADLERKGWKRREIYAAVVNQMIAAVEMETFDEGQRDQLMFLLHAAVFRMAEAVRDMQREEQAMVDRLSELFDGNRRIQNPE